MICSILPILGKAKDTGFEGHEFFEASSVRKINGKYYLIYSSVRSRELCYAISEKPDREYRYAGVLSDNSGVIEEQDKNRIQIMWGNNHGSRILGSSMTVSISSLNSMTQEFLGVFPISFSVFGPFPEYR